MLTKNNDSPQAESTATHQPTALPPWEMIKREISHWLASGRYTVTEYLPTAKNISLLYAVNEQTVRRALKALIAEGALCHTPRKGVFVPSPSRSTKRVALLLPDLADPRASYINRGVQKIIAKANLQYLILDTGADAEKEQFNTDSLHALRIDGAIIIRANGSSSSTGKAPFALIGLKPSGHPRVTIEQYIPDEELSHPDCKHSNCVSSMVSHLVEHGCRQFRLICDDIHHTSHAVSLYEQIGISAAEQLLSILNTDYTKP